MLLFWRFNERHILVNSVSSVESMFLGAVCGERPSGLLDIVFEIVFRVGFRMTPPRRRTGAACQALLRFPRKVHWKFWLVTFQETVQRGMFDCLLFSYGWVYVYE